MANAQSEGRPMFSVTLGETFSAGHRLYNPKFSEEENRKVFGICSNAGGHGHDYHAEFTLKGPLDESTGMFINILELKTNISSVLEELDHQNLNTGVEYFKEKVCTAENITMMLWEKMNKLYPGGLVQEVRICHYGSVISYKGEKN